MTVRMAVLLGVATVGLSAPAWAATFTVDSTADAVDVAPGDGICAAADGRCTLRAAVMEANAQPGPHSIVLPSGVYTLSLEGTGENGAATGDLDILEEITITGEGPQNTDRKTVIDGAQIDRVFEVFGTLRLEELTIENGRILDPTFDGGGGGISNSGFLYLTRVVVRGNSAMVGGGGILNYSDAFIADSTIAENAVVASPAVARDLGGGGICNESNLHVDRSTIFNNFAAFGGGLANDANAFITQSTLNGNTATNDGGGGIWNDSQLTVVSSTIAGNFGRPGSAILDFFATERLAGVTIDGELAVDRGTIALANTILAGTCVLSNGGTLASHGHNLVREASCALAGDGDVQSADLRLGALADNGGPTQTEALMPGSPAVDAGGDEPLSLPGYAGGFIGACPATDQRGIARPQGAHCDIGAYEAAPSASKCDVPTVPPESGVLTGHGWSAAYSVSARDGLVLEDVELGGRRMAQQMSVPYFRLEIASAGGLPGAPAASSAPGTAPLPPTRGELTPDGDQTVARSRLIRFGTHHPEAGATEPASVEAVYAIDRIPPDSRSCLLVTQRYELGPEQPQGGCEAFFGLPSVPPLIDRLNCSEWKPTIDYEFFGEPDQVLLSFNAPQRMHFRERNDPQQFVGLYRDQDDFPPAEVRVFPPPRARPRITPERALQVITAGAKGEADNYHQSHQAITEPGFHPGGNPLIGPGCPECVHIHWRWGKSLPNFPNKNNGEPIVPKGSNQDVEVAVVALHPGEEHPDDLHELIDGEPLVDRTGKVVPDVEPVFWYSATGHQPKDTFFLHGGFFQPERKADLALSADAPPSARAGDDLTITFTVTNRGPSFATDARLQAFRSQPAHTAFVPSLSSPECTVQGSTGGRIECAFGDIPPGVSRVATVVVHLGDRVGRFVGTFAWVANDRPDPDGSNNQVFLRTAIRR